jgi:AraC-like DNA-binding protein
MFPRILFDRTKYGTPLLVDACRIHDIDDFTVGGRSHRLGFYEVVLVTRGRGTLQLDDTAIDIAPRRAAVTGPGEVRRWRLADSTLDGFIVFFEAAFVNEFFREARFIERMPLMASEPGRRSLQVSRRPFDALAGIAADMCGEVRAQRTDCEHALRAQTYRLLVALQRMAAPALAARPACALRPRPISARFDEALEARYATHDRVEDYAQLLGVSSRHLNTCVREASGVTARETIGRRRYLEACRLLLHTGRSVAAISDSLGFSEPSWFIRFFKRRSGITPGAFRAQRESDISVPASDLREPGAAGHD